jgi:hypothetical protein
VTTRHRIYRKLFALAAILILHGPDGKPIYVATEHIVSVLNATGVHPRAKAVINTQSTALYVRETPEQVAQMLGVQP